MNDQLKRAANLSFLAHILSWKFSLLCIGIHIILSCVSRKLKFGFKFKLM